LQQSCTILSLTRCHCGYILVVICKRINPKITNSTLFDKIITLHQQHFSLDAAAIINYLQLRDYIDLYFNDTNQLVATVGIQCKRFYTKTYAFDIKDTIYLTLLSSAVLLGILLE
jgi:hypothetical protein